MGKLEISRKFLFLDDFQIISSSIATLDPVGRQVFTFLTKPANNTEFYLVSVNIDTGKVTNSVLACTSDPECPWSLEFLP